MIGRTGIPLTYLIGWAFLVGCLGRVQSTTSTSFSSYLNDNSNIILTPLDPASSAPNKLAVLVPGGLVPINTYVAPCTAIQNNTNTKLWVVIIYCLANLCDPLVDLNWRINTAIDGIKALVPSLTDNDIFILGHSLGGVGARHFVDSYPDRKYAGLAFYGTQYNGDSENFTGTLGYPIDLKSWPIPLLAITGELDMVPYSHTELLFAQSITFPQEDMLKKAVVVVPGMDHSAFCPGFHVKGDIVEELDPNQAVSIIGEISGAWIDVVSLPPTQSKNATATIMQWMGSTKALVLPYTNARKSEASWCTFAQYKLSGLPNDKYNNLDLTLKTVPSEFDLETTPTSYQLNNDILSITDVNYFTFDSSYSPKYTGALSVDCKCISSDRVSQELNLPVSSNVNCLDINQAAIDLAVSLLTTSWPSGYNRFKKQGRPLVLQPDNESYIVLQWVLSSLTWTEGSASVTIQSPKFFAPTNASSVPGSYFCKILSPVKVIEWIMTMSLTQRYN